MITFDMLVTAMLITVTISVPLYLIVILIYTIWSARRLLRSLFKLQTATFDELVKHSNIQRRVVKRFLESCLKHDYIKIHNLENVQIYELTDIGKITVTNWK